MDVSVNVVLALRVTLSQPMFSRLAMMVAGSIYSEFLMTLIVLLQLPHCVAALRVGCTPFGGYLIVPTCVKK